MRANNEYFEEQNFGFTLTYLFLHCTMFGCRLQPFGISEGYNKLFKGQEVIEMSEAIKQLK